MGVYNNSVYGTILLDFEYVNRHNIIDFTVIIFYSEIINLLL